VSTKYDVVIGLEIHAELNTATKIFCRCANTAGGADVSEPNRNVCPTCMGMPGALPAVNRMAVEKSILAGMAFGCRINDVVMFERKHYFYPDLPSGYQLTQLERPQCLGGGITLSTGKLIRLNRIHLEEDAGKLVHDEVRGETLVDLNRAGTPLIEMVTEPDISNAAEAVEFLEEVRSRLVYSGVADCKMEEGGMRCDVNISLKPAGAKKFGNRVEMKNLNSFKMVARAIEYETKRQAKLLDDGKAVAVQTRKWNDASGISTPMRGKEQEVDYRYMPDPDQLMIRITDGDVARIKKTLPKLAHELRAEFVAMGLPEYDADILTRDKDLTKFFINALGSYPSAKPLANWIMTHVLARATNYRIEISPVQLVSIIQMVDKKDISQKNALEIIDEIWGTEKDPKKVAKDKGFTNKVAAGEIEAIVVELMATNEKAVADYAEGPDKVVNFFMGQVMKRTGGRADSVVVKEIVVEKLS